MASIVNVLPFEIIGHIIDCLARDDHLEHKYKSTYVKACSLTCRTFLEAGCRKHIFRCVAVKEGRTGTWTTMATFQLFVKFLVDSGPKVGAYIREICFMLSSVRRDALLGQFAQALRWLTSLDTLIISAISNVPLYVRTRRYSPVAWFNLDPSKQSLLLNLIHLPTIRTLELQNTLQFPVVGLVYCPDLRHLLIERSSLDFGESFQSGVPISNVLSNPTPPAPVRLCKLDVRGNTTILSLPRLLENSPQTSVPALDPKDLHTVSLMFDDLQGPVLGAAASFFASARNLEEVYFAFKGLRPTELVSAVSLAYNSLETLRLLSLDIIPPRDCDHPLLGVPTVLQQMSGKNAMETFKICIRTHGTSFSARAALQYESGTLDKALLAPGGWPALKQVDITIVTGFERGQLFKNMLDSLPETQFPGLSSSKSIRFNFLVCEKL